MRLVTWNVHRCFGTDRRYDPARVLRHLSAFDVDVVLLQEIDSSLRSESGQNQLDYFADGLGFEALMGPTLRGDYGAYGNAILSRLEILSCEEHDLSFRRLEPRGALVANVVSPWGPLRIVNTHLGLKYWERAFQIDRLLSEIVWTMEENDAVLAGDFNEWFPWSGNSLRLERAFAVRTPREATFPSNWPRLALDRVFLTQPAWELRHRVMHEASQASDHLPVVAEFVRLAKSETFSSG